MRKCLLFVLLLIFLCTDAAAVDSEVLQRQSEILGADQVTQALPESALSRYEGFSDLMQADLSEGVQSILASGLSESGAGIRAALASAAMLLAVALLCALLGQLEGDLSAHAVRISGVLAVTLLSVTNLGTLVGLGTSTMQSLAAFSNTLLPVLAGATVASGAASTATVLQVGTVFFSDLLSNLLNRVFVPLCYAYLACGCAEAAMGNDTLRRLRELIKSVISTGLKAILICFSAYLAVTGVVSGSADSASVKAAKLALSSVVPVVGSVIGDASETVLVCAGILRNALGVVGLLGVFALCITPFLRLGVQYLVLKVTAALSGTVGAPGVVAMIDHAASCMGMILGMVGACALLNLISCVCFLRAVVPG